MDALTFMTQHIIATSKLCLYYENIVNDNDLIYYNKSSCAGTQLKFHWLLKLVSKEGCMYLIVKQN